MKGNLFGIGVGPGDPELLTIKAKRILETVKVVIVPKASVEAESLAYRIAKQYIPEDVTCIELVFPMTGDGGIVSKYHEKAIETIVGYLREQKDVVFLTLGDPTVYSTYMYIHEDIVRLGYHAEVVPGITSFCASAARAGISLVEGDSPLLVIPASGKMEKLNDMLNAFDNIVLMKVSKNFDEIRELLGKAGLSKNTVLVERCTLPEEALYRELDEVEGAPGYFSTMIIKRKKEGMR